jgi:colicin import membrane protein
MNLFLLNGKCRGNALLGFPFLRRMNRENIDDNRESFEEMLDIIYSASHQNNLMQINTREGQVCEAQTKEELMTELEKERKEKEEAQERAKKAEERAKKEKKEKEEAEERAKKAEEKLKKIEDALRQLNN